MPEPRTGADPAPDDLTPEEQANDPASHLPDEHTENPEEQEDA
jgi:hypothetical protein